MTVLDWLREAVFPTHCAACGAFGEWWCTNCRQKVEQIRTDLCPRCAAVGAGHTCALRIDELDAILATGFYHDPVLRSVVTSLKYKHATCLLPSVGMHLTTWSSGRVEPWPWAGESALAIQHVPATPRRVRERGFDQAQLFARVLQETSIPWARSVNVLRRRDGGETQASLSHGELRSANVHDAFSVVGDPPAAVLLVDDVLTTGSTMNEAARALRAAGAKKVYGFALAVGR